MYAIYNYTAAATFSQVSIVSNLVSLAMGTTDKTWLLGKILLSSQAVGCTSSSTTVTWAGAYTGVTIAVGQKVYGLGIPSGTTVATITDGTGFTLSNAFTSTTNSAAILGLGPTSTLPPATIGSTTLALGITNGSNQLTMTGAFAASAGIAAVGMQITGNGIPAATTISSLAANAITMSANATASSANTTVMLTPPSTPTNEADTTILTTYTTPAWEIWDQYGGTGGLPNVWVFRSPVVDDATFYKYMYISASNAGTLGLACPESQNNSTHAKTNDFPLNNSSTYASRFSVAGQVGTFHISCSSRHYAHHSISNYGIGGSTAGGWEATLERSRRSPWDTVAAGYPPCQTVSSYGALLNTAYTGRISRIKTATGDVLNVAGYLAIIGYSPGNTGLLLFSSNAVIARVPDGLGGYYTVLNELFLLSAPGAGFLGGSISSICDIWLGPSSAQHLDEIIYNSKNYVAWQNTPSPSTQGGFSFFPKG
jgi:hypothetical protein